ncbi:MAG: hypothetical protein NPIRA06_08980 [Nitrospirales bacterium]|nr:MAG: hypothetical protein NPIRA06_08980 [Nitrospirales bacterium]
MQGLSSRQRWVIRLHLGADVEKELVRLEQLIEASIGLHAHQA